MLSENSLGTLLLLGELDLSRHRFLVGLLGRQGFFFFCTHLLESRRSVSRFQFLSLVILEIVLESLSTTDRVDGGTPALGSCLLVKHPGGQ